MRTTHTHPDPRTQWAEFLASPASLPPVLVVPCERMRQVLEDRHARQERRRFLAEPETLTNFGSL